LIFENPVVEAGTSAVTTARFGFALGRVDDDYYLVVYTWRGDIRRVISAWNRYSLDELKALRARGKTRTRRDARSARSRKLFGSTLTWSCRARAKLLYTSVWTATCWVVSETGQRPPQPYERCASLLRGSGAREEMRRLLVAPGLRVLPQPAAICQRKRAKLLERRCPRSDS
jgi:hypothetical protein